MRGVIREFGGMGEEVSLTSVGRVLVRFGIEVLGG